ncbi:MAG: DUF2298 domain-containing protein [Ktedonobacterales bacterium]
MSVLFLWWALIEALGLVGLPLAALLFANLPDRGWALTKPLSLLTVGWLIWFPLALIPALPFSVGWCWATLLFFALGNAALLWRLPDLRATLTRMVIRQWAYIATSEGLFAGAFALMAYLRSFTPWLDETEKFMDEAFLAAIWRAPHLPPPDPWLSGETLNYYYFGHYLMALVAKLLGTQPGVAFNISVALVFALVATAIFGVAANIAAVARGVSPASSRQGLARVGIAAGLAGVVLTLMLGDLNGAQIWLHDATLLTGPGKPLGNTVWGWWLQHSLWPVYDWWTPSRVIPNTINEFPAFSFVLGDLHAHVLALPFAALAVAVAFNLLLASGEGVAAFGHKWRAALTIPLCAIIVGGLYAINGWDLPTYLGLALLALVIQQWLAHDRRVDSVLLLDLATAAVIFGALCFLLYTPFYRGFSSPGQGIGGVPAEFRTPVGYEVAYFGLPLFLVFSYLLLRLGRWASHSSLLAQALVSLGANADAPLDDPKDTLQPSVWRGFGVVAAIFAVLTLATWFTQGAVGWTLFWCIIIVLTCAALALHRLGIIALWLPAAPAANTQDETGETGEAPDTLRWQDRAELWVYLLVGTAAALVGVCEIVYLRDVFGGAGPASAPLFRMNTVFKLYYQAWLLLGIVSGPLLAWLAAGAWRAIAAAIPASSAATLAASRAGRSAAGTRLALAGASTPLATPETPITGKLTMTRQSVTPSPSSARREEHGGGDILTHTAKLAAQRRSIVSRTPLHKGEGDVVTYGRAVLAALWAAALITLLLAALIYPTMAVASRTANLTLSRSLDGTAYMAQDQMNVGDQYAIAWLNTHVSGDGVIVEAAQYGEYSHLGRISAFTGLPTPLGWGGHEAQWRVNWLAQPGRANTIGQRINDVAQIYTNPSQLVVLALLQQYHARYLYVGAAERATYPQADLSRFAAFLPVVYQRAGVTIYAVP